VQETKQKFLKKDFTRVSEIFIINCV